MLGGSAYNRVDITLHGDRYVMAVVGSVIDVSASQKGDVYIRATEDKYTPTSVYGVVSRQDAPSLIKTGSEGTVTISVSGYPETSPAAVAAIGNGASVRIESPKIFLEAEGHYPMAVRSGLEGSEVVLTNPHGALDLEITGISFNGEYSDAIHSAGSVRVTGNSEEGGQGDSIICNGNVMADGGGVVNIATGEGGDRVTVNGMFNAFNGSSAVIQTGGGDDQITIENVYSGTYRWANNQTEILIDAGDGNDRLAISNGIHTEYTATVHIDMGDGDDTVSVSGGIHAENRGLTIIDTGNGNDTIILNGAVDPGSLEIRAGEGTDTLVLHASSAEEFNAFYHEWLSGADTDAMGLEHVQVELPDGVPASGLDWLNDIFGDNVTLSYGAPDESHASLPSADFAAAYVAGEDTAPDSASPDSHTVSNSLDSEDGSFFSHDAPAGLEGLLDSISPSQQTDTFDDMDALLSAVSGLEPDAALASAGTAPVENAALAGEAQGAFLEAQHNGSTEEADMLMIQLLTQSS